MEQSILKSTKKVLQVNPDDEAFDLDIITHINSAFSTLDQNGVGPEGGFTIEDNEAVWNDFIPNTESNKAQVSRVKSFVWVHSRLLFDPPQTQFLLAAAEKQREEALWRINIARESTEWRDPNPPVPMLEDVGIIDGGGA